MENDCDCYGCAGEWHCATSRERQAAERATFTAPPVEVKQASVSDLFGTWSRNPNGCGCWTCNPNAAWFVVCGTCGNKRCPKANDHAHECTGSNEPGQKGSAYE